MHIPVADIRFCSRIPISGSKSENGDEWTSRGQMGKPTSYLALIGAGLTGFAYNFHLRACEHTDISQNCWMGESAIWHAQARARRGTGLRLPDWMCFVHRQGDIDTTEFCAPSHNSRLLCSPTLYTLSNCLISRGSLHWYSYISKLYKNFLTFRLAQVKK